MLHYWQQKTHTFPLHKALAHETILSGRRWGAAQKSGNITIIPILGSNCPTGQYASPEADEVRGTVEGPGHVTWKNRGGRMVIIPLHQFIPSQKFEDHVQPAAAILPAGGQLTVHETFSTLGKLSETYLPLPLRSPAWDQRGVKGHAKMCQALSSWEKNNPDREDENPNMANAFPLLEEQTGFQVWVNGELVAWEMGPDAAWWASIHESRLESFRYLLQNASKNLHESSTKVPAPLHQQPRHIAGLHRLMDVHSEQMAGQMLWHGNQVAWLSLFQRNF